MRQLIVLLITLTVTSCASYVPKKPKIYTCVLYVDEGEAVCGNGDQNPERVSLELMDRSVAIPVSDWVEYQTWIDLIHEYAERASECDHD